MSVTLTRPTLVNETTPGTGSAVNVAFCTDIFDRIDVAFALLAPLASASLVTPTLGAALATTINGNTLTTGTYTLTGAASKTLTFSNTLTLAGTDSTTMTFPSTSATLARTDAANTFTGHQTIEGVTSTGATGTGKFVFDGSPVLVTPTLGVATGTSLLVTGAVQTSASGSTAAVFGSTSSGGSCHFGAPNGAAYLGDTGTFGGSIRASIGALTMHKNIVFGWSSDLTSYGTLDVTMYRDGANIFAQRNTTSAQKSRIYNTFTTVETAYEAFETDWQADANICWTGVAVGTSSGTPRVWKLGYGTLKNAKSAAITIPATSGNIVFGGGVQLANAAVTGLSAGVLAGQTNASIVLYDSGGQAYRVPCII